VGLAMRVRATLDLMSAVAAGEGLALIGIPMFGMWRAPTQAHRSSTLRATKPIG
jgi:hypothetical protein